MIYCVGPSCTGAILQKCTTIFNSFGVLNNNNLVSINCLIYQPPIVANEEWVDSCYPGSCDFNKRIILNYQHFPQVYKIYAKVKRVTSVDALGHHYIYSDDPHHYISCIVYFDRLTATLVRGAQSNANFCHAESLSIKI